MSYITNILQDVVPAYSGITSKVVADVYPLGSRVDRRRFCRLSGLPTVVRPANSAKVLASAIPDIELDENPDCLVVGAIVSILGFHTTVTAIDTDVAADDSNPAVVTIQIDTDLLAPEVLDGFVNAPIEVVYVPVLVVGDPLGSSIVISSDYPLFPGDVVGVLEEGAPDTLYAIKDLGVTTVTEGEEYYTLTVDETVPSLSSSLAYLRAYPGFRVASELMPDHYITKVLLGPVYFDWLSGSTVDVDDPTEYVRLTTTDVADTATTSVVSKHHMIAGDISPRVARMLTPRNGHLLYGKDYLNIIPAVQTDDTGFVGIVAHFPTVIPEDVPYILQGQLLASDETDPIEYDVTITAWYRVGTTISSTAILDTAMVLGASFSVPVTLPEGCHQFELVFGYTQQTPHAARQVKFRFDGLMLDAPRTRWLTYTHVAQVYGRNAWASTLAHIKPAFLSIDNMHTRVGYSRLGYGSALIG